MSSYTETIYVGARDITVTASTPQELDDAIAHAREHWRTDVAAYFPDTDTDQPPWPTRGDRGAGDE